jgi:hypothetical protein
MMMGAASISETSVNSYQTTLRYNPEDSHLHTRCREDFKSSFILHLKTNKTENAYSLEYNKIPKVFFMPHHACCQQVASSLTVV